MILSVRFLEGPDGEAEDGAGVPAVLDDHGPAGGAQRPASGLRAEGAPGQVGLHQDGWVPSQVRPSLTWPAGPPPRGIFQAW